MRDLSLYVHVPFCVRRCSYCTFYHVPHIEEYEPAFVDALLVDLQSAADGIGEPFCCPTVFFGGGTPSVLSDDSLNKVFTAIDPFLPRDQTPEITLEANPEDVTDALLSGLRRHGVNRLSLGIQSMNPKALTTLKRCTERTNARGVDLVRQHFENFSLDVLLGVPDSSIADLQATMEHLIGYEPPHFSVYCLESGGVMEADVSDFFRGVDPERSAEEYMHVCESLERGGYHHYEISNFAKPGFESSHNRAYWRDCEYLGVGPGAHSYIAGERFHNEPSIERYIRETSSAVRSIERRGTSERETEQRMLALRTSDGLALSDLVDNDGIVDDLVARDLAKVSDDRLVLTDRGFLVLNEIVLRLSA